VADNGKESCPYRVGTGRVHGRAPRKKWEIDMWQKTVRKWAVLFSGTSFAALAVPGCENLPSVISQFLGVIVGA